MSAPLKSCKKCQAELPFSDFYVHRRMADGHLSFCKTCVKARVHRHYYDTREKQSEQERRRNQNPDRRRKRAEYQRKYRSRYSERCNARQIVSNAVRDGRLTPERCACGSNRVQAHHRDYSKPMDVEWVCFKCHRENEHGQVVTAEALATSRLVR